MVLHSRGYNTALDGQKRPKRGYMRHFQAIFGYFLAMIVIHSFKCMFLGIHRGLSHIFFPFYAVFIG